MTADEERPDGTQRQGAGDGATSDRAAPGDAARRAAAAVRDAAARAARPHSLPGPHGASADGPAVRADGGGGDAAGAGEGTTTSESRPGASVTPANGGGASAGHAVVDRSPQLRLARVHLRTGSLALARAELEAVAGRGDLDRAATLDLAEVRWRSGDLTGAGDAVASYLAGGGDETLGFVIAAEAAAAGGRPAEARRLAGRALERSEASLDAIFAGMSRSMIWPHDTGADASPGAGPSAAEGSAEAGADRLDAAARAWTSEPRSFPPAIASYGAAPSTGRPGPTPPSALQPGLWDLAPPAATRSRRDAEAELDAAIRAVRAGDAAIAAVHFGVALRLAPALAGAVLAAVGGSGDPSLQLVRGDCQRLLGREREARRAYLAAGAAARRAAATTAVSEGGDGPGEGPEQTGASASLAAEPPSSTADEAQVPTGEPRRPRGEPQRPRGEPQRPRPGELPNETPNDAEG